MRRSLGPVLLALLGVGACSAPEPARYVVDVTVRDADGEPVWGARIGSVGRVLTTDARGHATLELSGREGDRVELRLECPDGQRADPEAHVVVLRALRDLDGNALATPAALRCQPLHHEAIVLVHTPGARQLPVLVDGSRVADTGEHGVAHVLVRGDLGSRVEVTLDTSAHTALMPQRPTRAFELDERGALFVFDQAFKHKPAPRRRSRAPAPPPPPERLR